MYKLSCSKKSIVHIFPPVTGHCQMLSIGRSANVRCNDYFVLGGIRTCLDAVYLINFFNTVV